MASRARRFLHSPLRVILVGHLLCSLALLAVLAGGLVLHKRGGAGGAFLDQIGAATSAGVAGGGGVTLMYVALNALGVMLIASLAFGLVYGKWGLPGYLQGRAVFFVPFLSAVYFLIGKLVLLWIDSQSLGEAWRGTRAILAGSAGLTLVLLVAALWTSAVGLGWAIALAVTHYKRSRGKWETIGYVENP